MAPFFPPLGLLNSPVCGNSKIDELCSNSAHPLPRGRQQLVIHPQVVLSHSTSRESPFNMLTSGLSINFGKQWNAPYHLIHIMDQETCFPMHNQLWRCSTSKGDDRTSQCHRLDHDHAKGFLPLDWIEKPVGSTQQINFPLSVHWANVTNLLLIDLWFDDLMKVALRLLKRTVNSTGEHQRPLGSPGCFDRQVWALFWHKAPEPHQVIASDL